MTKIPTACSGGDQQVVKSTKNPSELNENDMRIAWRYNNLPVVDSEEKLASQYNFDLTKYIEKERLNELNVYYFDGNFYKTRLNYSSVFTNPTYSAILEQLQTRLSQPEYSLNSEHPMKNMYRICISSLGSPLWYEEQFSNDICLFLTVLKALIRKSIAVCCITIPSHLLKRKVRIYLFINLKNSPNYAYFRIQI